jgi:2-polyprenyl-3-methyl-5-hydroxy-6-metoxy-1,4-benzoquinol methylase
MRLQNHALVEYLLSILHEKNKPNFHEINTLILNMPFDDTYFSTHAYKDVSFARFSQYWWSNRFYSILVKRFGKKNTRLLEIGSGLGHLVGQLQKDYSSVATDVSSWALEESKRIAYMTEHLVSNAEELPFQQEMFSVLICKHVVEHLHFPEKAIMEMGRITAPDGLLVLATPNLDSSARKWKKEKWIGFKDPTHISLKSPAEWSDLVNRAGFQIFQIFSDGFWDAPYIPIIPKFLQKIIFGLPGGIQAVLAMPFIPIRWGESIIILARKTSKQEMRPG